MRARSPWTCRESAGVRSNHGFHLPANPRFPQHRLQFLLPRIPRPSKPRATRFPSNRNVGDGSIAIIRVEIQGCPDDRTVQLPPWKRLNHEAIRPLLATTILPRAVGGGNRKNIGHVHAAALMNPKSGIVCEALISRSNTSQRHNPRRRQAARACPSPGSFVHIWECCS